MKKSLAFLGLTVFTVLLCSSLVKFGQAGSISVGIYDTKGLCRDSFNTGEHVRITAESNHTSITVIVTDPDDCIVLNETYERTILGSSDGTAHQYFAFASGNVSDVSAWILEGETWVRWLLVGNFSGSDENSRHYLIYYDEDGVTWIQFGDGVNGRRPPTGEDNIGATYRTGVGEEGDVSGIQSLAGSEVGVREVENPDPASGGSDTETLIVYNRTFSGLTKKLGLYTVEASSPSVRVQRNYASVCFNAIPEVPLGTIIASAAMIIALAAYVPVSKRRKGGVTCMHVCAFLLNSH